MPVENPNPMRPEQPQDEWHQLAQDAAGWDHAHPGVHALYENHVAPQLHSKGLGHLVIGKNEEAAGQFLHEQNKSGQPLHMAKHVEFAATHEAAKQDADLPQKPAQKLALYLQRLSGKHSLIQETPDDPAAATRVQASRGRHIRRLTVDPKVAARQHLRTEAGIMYEQGRSTELDSLGIEVEYDKKGNLRFAIPEDLAERPDIVAEGVRKQEAQAKGLREWVDYVNGKDANYPDWFKFYALDGLTKLGAFDKEKGRFNRRDAETLAPYPTLSRGALAKVHSWLEDTRLNKLALPVEFEDGQRQTALSAATKGGNFGQLYVLALEAVNQGGISQELRAITDGQWKRYSQGSDPAELFDDLRGFGLDWCTATGIHTTESHIDSGDFDVFYSNDETGQPRIPRLAIRMERGQVAEARGIEPRQEVEGVLADTMMSRLETLEGGLEYSRKAADMKQLTALERLIRKNPEATLTKDDVRFLYELDHTIQGFGYNEDPRIGQLRQLRGEHDHAELKVLAVERLYESFESSLQGYRAVVGQLEGAPQVSDERLREMYQAKLAEWRDDGTLDYIAERIVTHGELYTPVMTPNAIASYQELSAIAKQFGEDRPFETLVYDEPYRQYSPSELSDALADDSPIRLSLLPSKLTAELSNMTVDQQKTKLQELREARPRLNLRVPSVLDAVTFWQTLRARGDKLEGKGTFDKTYIRHFNLGPKRGGSWSVVPLSYVVDGGEPSLDYSGVDDVGDARLSVG